MNKRLILITGTPSVGKTTLARRLAEHLNAQYINLTELSDREHIAQSKDTQRQTIVIDEPKMRRKLTQLVKQATADVVIDGHYAAAVTSKRLVTHVFVLRRNPHELREFMRQRGYNSSKQAENLEAEILDVCLVEALQKQNPENVCEIDITGKTVETTLEEVLLVLDGKARCYHGFVDWMGVLEREGRLDEYLKT